MKTAIKLLPLLLLIALIISCGDEKSDITEEGMQLDSNATQVAEKIEAYAPTKIVVDLSGLTENQQKVVKLLVEAGRMIDEIFWEQSAPNAKHVRDSLAKMDNLQAETYLKYVMINYGPYDVIHDNIRFVGDGTGVEKRPLGGGYYPVDMTKEEFETYVKAHPEQQTELESQYTIITRHGDKLIAVPFYKAYPQILEVAGKLEEAAEFVENESLKNYLLKRAEAFKTDEYFESDMAWMDIVDNDIDLIIGPIENYEDALFNYKTAYEAVVMVRDIEATEQLQLFNEHVQDFENNLPYDDKYKRKDVGSGTQLNFVNVVYFGGDCQKGTKTIACSLPNDPKVREAKGGGKNSMYKNMMEAKFEKIVIPIAKSMLDPDLVKYISKKAFMSFVTLHEISHTLGRGYVYGNDELSIRKALKERYSAIEETKADIMSVVNHKLLAEKGIYDEDYLNNVMATYLPGLYRSIRFGVEEAHGRANLIQLNFLKEKGAIKRMEDGKFTIDKALFYEKAAELAGIILTLEAEGDYDKAGEILEKYGQLTDEIKEVIESLKGVPRDLNTSYGI